MGTRADFYIGRGETAKWLGSIAWDGYPDGISDEIRNAKTEEEFRDGLVKFFSEREDVTLPAMGWPWPWDDSRTTDYAYAFDGGKVYASCFGHSWFDADKEQPEYDTPKDAVFPDMKNIKNVTMGERSGVILITG